MGSGSRRLTTPLKSGPGKPFILTCEPMASYIKEPSWGFGTKTQLLKSPLAPWSPKSTGRADEQDHRNRSRGSLCAQGGIGYGYRRITHCNLGDRRLRLVAD